MEMHRLSPAWEYVADTVMGGVSSGGIAQETVQGRAATVLRGDVSLDNNGGFVQMASDLNAGGRLYDASDWDGVALEVCGNDATYDFRLRTDALSRPWQSFRTDFIAPDTWQTVRLPFADVSPHKTDAHFDPARLRRIGILAIGREMQAEIAVAAIHLYRG
ncbi:MAG: CIA30 family protein [Pseudomonadota bacterium]